MRYLIILLLIVSTANAQTPSMQWLTNDTIGAYNPFTAQQRKMKFDPVGYYNKNESDERYVLESDTVPSGTFMTKSAANNAIASINAQIAALTTSNVAEGSRLYFTDARARNAISLTTTGSGAATYNSSTGVFNIPTNTGLLNPTFNTNPNRAINTNFTVSSTRPSFVSYGVLCTVTNPLLVGTSTASVFLEYSTNAGSTWFSAAPMGNSSGVGITVTLQLTNGQTGTLAAWIPANALVRVRSTTSGTATVALVANTQQEVTF